MIPNGEEALEVARGLSDEFAAGAAERDAERRLPVAEVAAHVRQWAARDHRAARARRGRRRRGHVAEVFRLLAAGDPNLAQIPQSQFVYINVLKQQGTPAQQAFFFAEVLAGKRLGNAQSEAGTKHLQDIRTRLLSPAAEGGYLLSGRQGATARARCSPTGFRCSRAGRTTSLSSPTFPRTRPAWR